MVSQLQWNGHGLGATLGQALPAAALVTLGLSMLLLWWRRRTDLHGLFGLVLLGWALQLLWSLAPAPLLPWRHEDVWAATLGSLAVALSALFCLRLAQWCWPLLERAVLAFVALSPPLLYAAPGLAGGGALVAAWRAAVTGLLLLAALALARAALRASARDRAWLAAGLATALAAAVHDAGSARAGADAVPLLPGAGLLLAAFMSRVLIDRLLHRMQALEVSDAELARRLRASDAELQQARAQARRAREEAAAADLAKARFLAAASHDLRQPAHALGLYMGALRAGPLAPAQAELAARMAATLAALDGMFTALLDVSRIDAGAVQPQWDVVALAPLLRRLADEWATAAEARGLRLSLHLAQADAVTVTDALLLERVLRNLLANAVKYTAQGGVLLACRRRDGHYRIEVWDSGVGIAAADQERVFEEFFQVGNPARDRTGGLGLGLAIVRRLVRLLQLRLALHSRPGRGSVFFIDGLAPAAATPRALAAARSGLRRLAGITVAVLEDDADARDALGRLLRLWDCRVHLGAHADALLQEAAVAPAALIADLRLAAGRQGPDEVRRLFAAWGREVPLLFVSGETGPQPLRALQAAGHTCLAKPVSPARLRAWLEQALAPPASDGEQ